jgi:hypothetical protein
VLILEVPDLAFLLAYQRSTNFSASSAGYPRDVRSEAEFLDVIGTKIGHFPTCGFPGLEISTAWTLDLERRIN